MIRKWCAAISVFLAVGVIAACAGAAADEVVPPGTVITLDNWQRYKAFMPTGMQVLFEGKTFWKMPPDFKLVVGKSTDYRLPKVYLDNTAKYAKQVKIIDLPGGAHALSGYVAGLPFPSPAEPMKGYKILADMWYRYIPYLFCGNEDQEVLENSAGQRSDFRVVQVWRRLSHISDVGQPINDPRAQGVDYSEFVMFTEPEQYKYTEILTLFYTDYNRPEADFVFVPQLRRVIRQSSNSRCAPITNGDFTPDDLSGFNGGITRFQSEYLRDQPILTLVDADPKAYGVQSNYYLPLFFPKPVLGNWEIRDSYVIDLRRVPSQRAGYCYGKIITYIDKHSFVVLWKDLYNTDMRLFKINMSLKIAAPVQNAGIQYSNGNVIEAMWDIDKNHCTLFVTTMPGGTGIRNGKACRNVDGVNYDDINQYSTVGGLTQVMR
jgi:hypothetical protein